MAKKTPSQTSNRETEIIRRCQKGESDPFAELVDAYKEWIYRQIFFWVGDPEVAQEMAQEVFLKAYSQIGKFRGEAKFSTWLFQIARNRCRDHWRSKERHLGQHQSWEEVPEPPGLSPEAEDRAIVNQEIRKMKRALETLPEIYREALTLRFLNERSYDEIAGMLEEGVSSVKMRVARGVDLLRTKLKEIKP